MNKLFLRNQREHLNYRAQDHEQHEQLISQSHDLVEQSGEVVEPDLSVAGSAVTTVYFSSTDVPAVVSSASAAVFSSNDGRRDAPATTSSIVHFHHPHPDNCGYPSRTSTLLPAVVSSIRLVDVRSSPRCGRGPPRSSGEGGSSRSSRSPPFPAGAAPLGGSRRRGDDPSRRGKQTMDHARLGSVHELRGQESFENDSENAANRSYSSKSYVDPARSGLGGGGGPIPSSSSGKYDRPSSSSSSRRGEQPSGGASTVAGAQSATSSAFSERPPPWTSGGGSGSSGGLVEHNNNLHNKHSSKHSKQHAPDQAAGGPAAASQHQLVQQAPTTKLVKQPGAPPPHPSGGPHSASNLTSYAFFAKYTYTTECALLAFNFHEIVSQLGIFEFFDYKYDHRLVSVTLAYLFYKYQIHHCDMALDLALTLTYLEDLSATELLEFSEADAFNVICYLAFLAHVFNADRTIRLKDWWEVYGGGR